MFCYSSILYYKYGWNSLKKVLKKFQWKLPGASLGPIRALPSTHWRDQGGPQTPTLHPFNKFRIQYWHAVTLVVNTGFWRLQKLPRQNTLTGNQQAISWFYMSGKTPVNSKLLTNEQHRQKPTVYNLTDNKQSDWQTTFKPWCILSIETTYWQNIQQAVT